MADDYEKCSVRNYSRCSQRAQQGQHRPMRISPKLIRTAAKRNALLPLFLRANRNIESAHQELKWVQNELPSSKWKQSALLRNNLYPLQYILGTQPFGSLEIKCKPNVLIPRPETEEWVLKLCGILKTNRSNPQPFRVVDACTGSGCIALLTKHELGSMALVSAFDVSSDAVALATENMVYNGLQVAIERADLKDPDLAVPGTPFDLVLSNPPYIPLQDYKKPVLLNGVEKSVREYEPKLALVGDKEFYSLLLANLVLGSAKANAFVFELGYLEQAQFVKNELAQHAAWTVGVFYDYSGNIRCCIGWRDSSGMEFLRDMCSEVI